MKKMYLVGWKEAANYIGVTPNTLRKWSVKYVEIPWQKDGKHRSRCRIPIALFELWYESMRKTRRELDGCGERAIGKKVETWNPKWKNKKGAKGKTDD